MFENVPHQIRMVAFAGVLLAAPVTFFAFLFGGFPAGATALGVIVLT